MSAFAIDHAAAAAASGEQSPAGQCSPTSLYQTLQTLHLAPTQQQQQQPGPVTGQSQFTTADVVYRPAPDELVNGPPYPVDMVGPSFPLVDALSMSADDPPWIPACPPSSSYACAATAVPPNLQVIREDPLASSQGTVSESGGSRSETPQGRPVPTISPPHPVISVTDALGRVMPVVMVTQSDDASDSVPMDESSAAAAAAAATTSLVDFPAGYFSGYNYPTADSYDNNPVDLSTSANPSRSGGDAGAPRLCSTVIRTQRCPVDLYADLSRALESSSAKDLVRRCDAESGLFVLADASVSLEVRVSCGDDDRPAAAAAAAAAAIGQKSTNQQPAAALLCFRHLAGDVALYDSVCRDLVSRLSL